MPITLSWPLTWSLRLMRDGQVRHLAARGPCARALSVLVSLRFAYLAVLRVFGWLALLARSDRAKDAGDPDLAPSGRRAPASGQDSEAVVGRPGGAGRAGPAAARQPAPPAAPDRLPADPAALARRPGPAALGLPAPRSRAAPDGAVRAGAGAGDGPGQPGLGLPAHPRRAGRPGTQARAVDGVADPQGRGHRPRAHAVRADLAGVPGRPGQDDPGRRLLPRRYRVPAPPVRAVLHRARHPARAPGRDHRSSRRGSG